MPVAHDGTRFAQAAAIAAALIMASAWPAFASHPEPAEVKALEQRRSELEDRRQLLHRQQTDVDRAAEETILGRPVVGPGETTGTVSDARAADRQLFRLFAESHRLETELEATAEQQTDVESRLQVAEAAGAGGSATGPRLFHPAPGHAFGSAFGQRRHPITGTVRLHAGVDIGAPTGTPVLAAADGRVAHAGWMGGYGLTVDILHADGLSTRYAHLSQILVDPGQSIAHEEPLGHVGSTGQSTGPHLHFEVRRDGTPVDPATFYDG